MKKSLLYLFLFAGLFTFTLTSCEEEEEPIVEIPNTEKTVAAIAADDAQFSTLVSALERVDLVSVLNGAGPFTVFAPTNTAFEALGVDLSTISDEALTEILLYHVFAGGSIRAADIADGQTYLGTAAATGPKNANLSMLVEKAGTGVTINGTVNVTATDIIGSNGVIHVVDAVITPLDVVGHAVANSNFSDLVGALGASSAGLVDILSDDETSFTVFAPTNTAFQNLGVDPATLEDAALTEILLYHVIAGGSVFAGDIAEGQTYISTAAATGPNGTNLSALVEKGANGVAINNAVNVIITDVVGTNGVIHAVDAVITPLDVVGHAVANSNFTELVGALGAASGDLVNVLSGEGPFTVFAPVNSAFEAISEVAATLSADQLAAVLTYHVTGGNVTSGDLADAMMVETVNGEMFRINLGDDATITDAQGNTVNIVLTDVQGTNGIIHVLDAVILPADL